MRVSVEAVAVPRDVASSSPSKPAAALDMMRYANPESGFGRRRRDLFCVPALLAPCCLFPR
jgi:hypothetical protein